MDDRPARTWLVAAGVFAVALAVHVGVWAQYRADPFAQTLVADALSYDEWAVRLARAGLAREPVFHQSPLLPLLLAGTYRAVAPDSRLASALVLQLVLSSMAIALLVPIGRDYLGSRVAGAAGAVLALLHGPVVFYSLKLLPVTLALFTQALGLALLGAARRHGRRASLLAALAGAAWGAACLARSEMLLFAPLAAWAAAARPPGESSRRRWAHLLAFGVGCALVIAPVTVHNLARDDLVLIASAGGENLYAGNQAGATGGHTPIAPQAPDIFSQRVFAHKLAEREAGHALRPSEVSRHWRRQALRAVTGDPAAWLAVEARKLGRLFHPGDPTDIYSFALERALYLPLLWALALTPWALLVLATAGAVVALRSARPWVWPLLALLAVQALVLLVFFVDNRLRLPLLFFCAPLGGLAVVEGVRRWSSGRDRRRVLGVAALVALALVAGLAATRPTARDRLRLSSVLSMQDRLDAALAVLAPDLDRSAPDSLALDQAGWILQKQGRLTEARDRYRQALAIGLPPGRTVQVRTRLGLVHERLGDLNDARAAHDAAVADAGASAGAYHERGLFRLRRGDRAGAIADFEEAVRRDPTWPDPRRALAGLGVAQPGASGASPIAPARPD